VGSDVGDGLGSVMCSVTCRIDMGGERGKSQHTAESRAMPFASSRQRLTEHFEYNDGTADRTEQCQTGTAELFHTCLRADPCFLGNSLLQTSTPASRRHMDRTP
jgi:hypothetical protein